MPGPKMGPRPPDFNEELIRQSPTIVKWSKLKDGEVLKYACREFMKGRGDDEERLMRRIMIARRNNLKDHGILKQARRMRPRPKVVAYSDTQVKEEMDTDAVLRTRSYRTWSRLKPGETFVYNQEYTKGVEGHDWLLQKNIWRRMRYRRENKKMVQNLVLQPSAIEAAVAAAVQTTVVPDDTITAALDAQFAFQTFKDDDAMIDGDPVDVEGVDAALLAHDEVPV